MKNSSKIISAIILGSMISSTYPQILHAEGKSFMDGIENAGKITPEEQAEFEKSRDEHYSQYKYKEATLNKLKELEKLITIAEKDTNLDKVKEIYNFFTNEFEFEAEEILAHKMDDEFDQAFIRIDELILRIDKDKQKELWIDFQNKLAESFLNGNEFYKNYMEYNYYICDIDEIRQQLKDIINNAYNIPISGGTLIENPIDDVIDNGYIIGTPEDVINGIEVPPTYPYPEAEINNQLIEYEKEGDNYYKVTKIYDENNNLIKVVREKATEDEYVYFGNYDYIDFGGGVSSNLSIEDNYSNWKYINETQNPESNMTIQYTLNRDTETPYYFDTGIRVSLDDTVSYEQLRDVLYQVSIKSGGYFVEDRDKMLSIVEGRPIVVKKTKATYSKSDVDNVFKEFKKVEIRIMETRIGASSSLEERIVSKQANKVKVEGNDLTLKTSPIIKDGRALLPIEQIAKELGADIIKSNDKYIIKKDENTVVYEKNKSYVLINGQVTEMGTSPEIRDNVILGEIQEMAKIFGYDVMWDGEDSAILLNKIE